jgi:aryl-alcohol dehydrogenase-like predicted oxidoreductase
MWGKKKNQEAPTYLKDAPQETQDYIRAFLLDILKVVMEQLLQWALETIKHLIVLNAAGLAGVVAMYSATAYAPKVAATHAGAAFLVGIAIAFAALASGYVTGILTLRSMSRRYGDVIQSRAPTQAIAEVANKGYVALNWLLALASLIAFIVGVARLLPIL